MELTTTCLCSLIKLLNKAIDFPTLTPTPPDANCFSKHSKSPSLFEPPDGEGTRILMPNSRLTAGLPKFSCRDRRSLEDRACVHVTPVSEECCARRKVRAGTESKGGASPILPPLFREHYSGSLMRHLPSSISQSRRQGEISMETLVTLCREVNWCLGGGYQHKAAAVCVFMEGWGRGQKGKWCFCGEAKGGSLLRSCPSFLAPQNTYTHPEAPRVRHLIPRFQAEKST